MTADETEAGGNASVAIGGDAPGAQATTTHVEAPGGKVEITHNYGTGRESRVSSISPPINTLPPVAPAFTGRGGEEDEIVAALVGHGGSAAISALKGIGGVGKTALAVKIGHRLTVQFPDAQFQGRCLAFAHPSMGAGIDDNVNRLIAHLSEELPRIATIDVDIVAHSRGGLVSRAIAAAAEGGKLPLRIGKLVMVGAPNRGTPLTDGKHWKDFIDRYTNLLVTLPDGALTVSLEGVLCLVKIIGGGAVEGLPGLAAMQTHGEVLTALKKERLGDVRLHAIVADFSPAQDTAIAVLRRGGKDAIDAFFDEANDLVVPTKGCYDLTDTEGFPLPEDRVHEFSGGVINHVNFFQHQEVRSKLATLLAGNS